MKKMILALALVAGSTAALADWVPTYKSGAYTATLSYSASPTGPTQSISKSEAIPAGGYYDGPISNFARLSLSTQPRLQAVLDSWAHDTAVANGAGYANGKLSGVLTTSIVGLTGAKTGENQIQFSGPSYSVSFSKSDSRLGGLISATCTSNISLSNVTVKAVYVPLTGALDKDPSLSTLSYGSTSSSSCSSSLDWIPILGTVVDNFLAAKVNSIVLSNVSGFSGQSLMSLIPNLTNLYQGVDSAIASGVYVFNGVDWGAYIKNNFNTLFTGKSLSVSIGQPIVEGPYVAGTSEPSQTVFRNTDFVINFSDSTRQLIFTVASSKTYAYTWKCTPQACREP